MIDTDKYEGHTEGHWTWMGEEVFVDEGPTIARITSDKRADANLIADAPLLLAEVERLRGLLQEVADDYTDADGITYEIYCEFGGEEE